MNSIYDARRFLENKLDLKKVVAFLGKADGTIKADGGTVWVRIVSGVDQSGNPQFSDPFQVRAPFGVGFPFTPGAAVRLHRDDDDEIAIKGADHTGAIAGGYDTSNFNIGNPYTNQVAELNILKPYPLGTATTPSTKVAVTQLIYLTHEGELKFWSPSLSDAVDLSTYAPGTSSKKRLVLLYLNPLDGSVDVVQGSEKSELLNWIFADDVEPLISTLSPQAIPFAVWQIANGQTAVTQQDLIYNLRQLVNTDNRLVVKTTDPTTGDDVAAGYGRLTWWLNTTDDGLFVCVDNSASAAVWTEIGSSGGGGTVTSVGLSTTAGWMTVSGSPVTASGTLAINPTSGLTANHVLATPDGSTGPVSLRALVADDLPTVPQAKIDTIGTGTAGRVYTNGTNLVVLKDTKTTTNPTVSDDNTAGYSVGSTWWNTTQRRKYECLDASTGAAVWRELTIAPNYVQLWHKNSTIVSGNAVAMTLSASQPYQFYSYQFTAAAADSFEQTFVLRAGTYTLRVLCVAGSNRGVMKWTLDGVDVVTGQNHHAAAADVFNTIFNNTVTVTYTGTHTLRGTVTSAGSGGNHYIAITNIELLEQ